MTKVFGRGTDFQVLDKRIHEEGGVHIIQTFLSEEETEEIQIKGRTNRQNSPGSVDIIFSKNELKLLSITSDLSLLPNHTINSLIKSSRERKGNKFF